MERTNYSYLLIALLVLLFGIPVADDLSILSGPVARSILSSCMLIIGVWTLRASGRLFVLGMAFAVIGIVLNAAAANSLSLVFLYGSFASLFGFLLLAIWCALRDVVAGTEISANRLIGALCIYLMLGIVWAIAYTVLDLLAPDSFLGIAALPDSSWDSGWLYFSFVTMTTLGYGDISPASSTARFLSYAQAVVGQFYIAILVAGLVSAYISKRRNESAQQ